MEKARKIVKKKFSGSGFFMDYYGEPTTENLNACISDIKESGKKIAEVTEEAVKIKFKNKKANPLPTNPLNSNSCVFIKRNIWYYFDITNIVVSSIWNTSFSYVFQHKRAKGSSQISFYFPIIIFFDLHQQNNIKIDIYAIKHIS